MSKNTANTFEDIISQYDQKIQSILENLKESEEFVMLKRTTNTFEKKTVNQTQTPLPTTQTPLPTTQTPLPTTQTPLPTTQTPLPTTQTPLPTTQTPLPTTQTPFQKPVMFQPRTILVSNPINLKQHKLESRVVDSKKRNNTQVLIAGIITGIIVVSIFGMPISPFSQTTLSENFTIDDVGIHESLLVSAPATNTVLVEFEMLSDTFGGIDVKEEPAAVPVEPAAVPVEPAAVPVEPAAVPVEPAAVPVEPAAVPVEPAAVPVEPAAVPVEPAAVPVEPAAVPVEPAAVPVEPKYDMVNDAHATLTFIFRDGVETHKFPVFKMTSDFVSNTGTTFKVQGVVKEAPHLHKALDESFNYRMMMSSGASFEYDYRFFDVIIDISTMDENIRILNYGNCEILSYRVNTENDDYESYGFYSNTGFAVVDEIEFRCGGINFNDENNSRNASVSSLLKDYGQTPFKYAEDARVFITFKFDDGIEKIEFPIFELTTGFAENNDASPSFHVEDIIINKHTLLDDAINKARDVSKLPSSFNNDFDAVVEITNNGEIVRGLEFNECVISGFMIDTYQDKEEGYTGKRGFALIEKIDFTCGGLKPQNPSYENIRNDLPIWSSKKIVNEYMRNPYNMGTGPHTVAVFKFNEGEETIVFPLFKQGNTLDKANSSFELVGIPGQYPLLYNVVDDTKTGGSKTTGVNQQTKLFDVDINLMYGDKMVRGFNYVDCRSTDYIIKTQHDKEESFYKGFALTNEFHIECQGYHPHNPIFDAMNSIHEQTNTINTNDLEETHEWGPEFYIK